MEEEIPKLKREISKRDYRIRELETLVTHDPLTGLLNRRGFRELVERFFAQAKRHVDGDHRRHHFVIDSFAIAFFDIDNFKKINDSYGHETGDKILQFTSALIREKVRSSDMVGRWGGEEIVAAMLGANEKDAAAKADEIRRAIKSRVGIPQNDAHTVTISVGVAELKAGESFERLVQKADEAMYLAKTSGKDRVVRWSSLLK